MICSLDYLSNLSFMIIYSNYFKLTRKNIHYEESYKINKTHSCFLCVFVRMLCAGPVGVCPVRRAG
ncbi:Uncharacterised protein [Segatella copri]|nr:Uncharacterised protein [Segatella copri]